MNILQINTSARPLVNGQGSISALLANEVSSALLAATPGAQRVLRNLTAQPHPTLDEAGLQALFTPAEARTPAQAARMALDDVLIAELQAADVLVLAAPMYNFGITSLLKNWIDAVARAKVTFEYTATGPRGLLTGKRVVVVLTRGGVYRDTPSDTVAPYLRNVLGFLGMTDVQFVYAEGLAMGPDAEVASLAGARAQIAQLLPAAQPA